MKILVCISKTPETTAKIAFANENTEFESQGVQYILNPYDEWYALVRALELVEQHGGEVVLAHVGPAANDSIIRKGLAVGATRAVRIDCEAHNADQVAAEISAHAKDNGYDLVLCGKETIDYNGSSVGSLISASLDWPYFSFASHMDIEGSQAKVTRDIEGGVEVATAQLPIVVSAAKGLAEQRIPKMKDIMMSKKKPIDVISPTGAQSKSKVVKYRLPEGKSGVKMIDPENMDELVRCLVEEAKVL